MIVMINIITAYKYKLPSGPMSAHQNNITFESLVVHMLLHKYVRQTHFNIVLKHVESHTIFNCLRYCINIH